MRLSLTFIPAFSLRQGALSLEGSVREISTGLRVSLEAAELSTPLGPLSLRDVGLVLSGYATGND